MKKTVFLVLFVLLVTLVCSLAEENSLYVPRIDNLPADFIMGMDVSSVLALENSGVKYFDRAGNEADLFKILRDSGVNWIRVRVWNDPFTADGKGYGGGNCDINTAIAIGRRATANGMRLLVDFHYSDFWADPSKQQAPKAWQGLKLDAKVQKVYDYTYDCLTQLKEAGVDVGMIQLGNETNGRLCGEKIWMSIYKLMNAGSKAARAVDPDIKIAVHFANPEVKENYLSYAFKLDYYSLDYDVFATSYYPYWHGSLENLKDVLLEIKTAYGKEVLVAETSYAYTAQDTDFSGNTIGEGGAYEKPYPFTVQGQANHVSSLIAAMNDINALGIFYWEGAWISAGGATWEENSRLWETYGSGWASSSAAEYDPDDAGKYYGGCACDNQAMFDANGRALESVEVFRLVREGNLVPVAPDAIEDIYMMCDINADFDLPATVNAVMNDMSLQTLPVTWERIDKEALRAGGVKDYTFTGEANGMQAALCISMVEYNYVADYSFEEKLDGVWTATNLRETEQLYSEEKKSDSKTGKMHYHFYSAKAKSVEFTLEQEIASLPAGDYRYEISIMGGDGGNTNIYAYVKINGEMLYAAPAGITSYLSWDTPVIEHIHVGEGDAVTIGIYVQADGAGAWGKIDDAKLNRE